MPNIPLVTVVCTSYNHEPYIERSLNSVINQDYKNIELIVVDNGSIDNSVAVIKEWITNYPNVTFIQNKENIGNNKSFNAAINVSKGDYLIDLAADDVLLKHTIQTQINCFLNNPNAALVFGNAEIIDENDTFLYYHFPIDSNLKVLDTTILKTNYESILKGGKCMCSVSGMYKRAPFLELNGYDENLVYEDLDYWLRLSKKYPFIYIDEPLVQKRFLNNSLLASFYKKNEFSKKMNKSTYIILTKAYYMNTSKNEFKALLKRVHYEIIHNLKLKNFSLVVKLFLLKIKAEYKIRLVNWSSNFSKIHYNL